MTKLDLQEIWKVVPNLKVLEIIQAIMNKVQKKIILDVNLSKNTWTFSNNKKIPRDL